MVETCDAKDPRCRNIVHATSVLKYVCFIYIYLKSLLLNDVFHDEKIVEVEKDPRDVTEHEQADDTD